MQIIYAINLPLAVTLGEAYDGVAAILRYRSTWLGELSHWVVGLHQKRRRRLFELKTELSVQYGQLAPSQGRCLTEVKTVGTSLDVGSEWEESR